MTRRLAFIVAVVVFAMSTFAFAQGKKEKGQSSSERSVSGVVSDADGSPVPGAVVQLKNTKTLQVRSFIARDKGDYYFHGLSTDVDYELKADANGKSSGTKTLSSFDSKKEATINLQLK